MPKEELTREQEIKMLAEFIKQHGATQLPPDERLQMDPRHVWDLTAKMKAKKKEEAKKKKEEAKKKKKDASEKK